jgi:hypothetical protein
VQVSKVLVAYGSAVLARPALPEGQLYDLKYKGVWICLSMLARAMSGNYVNFGVFDLYGDRSLKDALDMALRMVLAVPLRDIMAYKKVRLGACGEGRGARWRRDGQGPAGIPELRLALPGASSCKCPRCPCPPPCRRADVQSVLQPAGGAVPRPHQHHRGPGLGHFQHHHDLAGAGRQVHRRGHQQQLRLGRGQPGGLLLPQRGVRRRRGHAAARHAAALGEQRSGWAGDLATGHWRKPTHATPPT